MCNMKKKHLMKVLLVCNTHANYSRMHENKKKNSADNIGPFIFIYFFFFNGMFTDQSARCTTAFLR